MHHDSQHETSTDSRKGKPVNWSFWIVFCGFTAFAALLLIGEHRNHLLGALPYLILLACPFLHLFMHRGHGHGNGDSHHGHRSDEEKRP